MLNEAQDDPEPDDDQTVNVSEWSYHDDLMRRGLPIDQSLRRFPAHGAWEKAQALMRRAFGVEGTDNGQDEEG